MRLPPQFSGLTALAVLATMPSWARACWEEAAQRYGISANLLYAIARVESNLNPKAVNRTHSQRTGSYDIGLMQINSGHLSTLAHPRPMQPCCCHDMANDTTLSQSDPGAVTR